jgi:CheY-like chemotaxis protein
MNEPSAVAITSSPSSPAVAMRADYRPDAPAGESMAQRAPRCSLDVLCIDDDPQVLELLKTCLSQLGHRVSIAPGGREGIEKFRAAEMNGVPYDVVITDMGMPEIDGRQVAWTIKAESPRTPVIILTGWGVTVRGDAVITSSVDAVVSKPPHIRELNELLLRMVLPAQPCYR